VSAGADWHETLTESADAKGQKLLIGCARLPPHDVDPFGLELEGGILKFQHLVHSAHEHVAVVDVHDAPVPQQQDVPVVPVLDLQNVANDRVGGHAVHKILLRV